jgi:hypothetical protein
MLPARQTKRTHNKNEIQAAEMGRFRPDCRSGPDRRLSGSDTHEIRVKNPDENPTMIVYIATARCDRVEVDDALELAEQTEV